MGTQTKKFSTCILGPQFKLSRGYMISLAGNMGKYRVKVNSCEFLFSYIPNS